MPRIAAIDPEDRSTPATPFFDELRGRGRKVLSFWQELGHSPGALRAYDGLSQAVNALALPPKLRELVSLYCAQKRDCAYCLAAHTLAARKAGATAEQMFEARRGRSTDPREQAALTVVAAMLEHDGRVPDAVFAAARESLSEQDLVELTAVVAIMTFSSYLNLLADTPLDLPPAPPLP